MPLRYWLFVAVTLGLTAFIGYGTYSTARLLRTWRPNRNVLLLPAENLFRLLLILVCGGLGQLSGLPHTQLGWTFPRAGDQVVLGISLGVMLALFFYGATRWLTARTGHRYYSPLLLEIIVPRTAWELLGVLLALIPVVLLEELLFRSLLVGGLLPILPAPLLVVGWGILFGLMHSPQGLWGMTGASLAGIFLGVLFLEQGSLLTPLVTHYVANAVQIWLAMGAERPESVQ
ncbi:CPBP family intramembrane metalloprotease [Litorilinea aerophila]|uniref:CPBP family intramembrane metalloprotease n=1 Tax=Litorilinea aerophila TaxID=1204385 RepID=A0A540VIL1_9CHLR|nr:CPBP family intramembrane glutamic endopeptidase [Litorilinea aerophila]MCC9075809.1 CPBP family intramembrane metalloprotease [Litorilinea aerophila]GIV77264.1 MAG: hypothetical protein KatS3mg050_1658 [Litorilinea sp.]